MSFAISGIAAVEPVYAPNPAPLPYAHNAGVSASVAETTAGAETGAVSVVYEPSASDTDEQHIYANPDPASRALAAPAASSGDAAVVKATGGTALPPPSLPETPHSAQVKQMLTDVWAPVGPIVIDPAAANVGASVAPPPAGQAEAAAQASYAAIADAMIAGAPLSDLEKFA